MPGFDDLFAHNMDEVLQEIFLFLEPAALHAARQVRFGPSWNSDLQNFDI